jgi:hypothetical protein
MHSTLPQVIDRALASNEVLAVVIAAILSLIGWVLLRIYTGRPKVAWAFSHQHAFLLNKPSPPLLAYTKEIWIQNIGRALAENVELILPAEPPHFDVWPQLRFEKHSNPEGSVSLNFDHLNPREHVTISIFQTNIEPLSTANVRWQGGVGKQVPMGPRQLFPKWWSITLQGFVLFGFFSFFYFMARLIWG